MTPTRHPRILVVTNMWPTPDRPMAGIFVAEQVASLRRRGLELDVLFLDGGRSKLEYLRGIRRVRRALATTCYDLIHAHYVFSGMVALAGRGSRVPVLLTHHGIETQQGWTAPLCRWTSRWVERTIVTSRRVQRALGRPDAEVVPCGVDTDLFHPIAQGEARAALGLPADRRLVLFAGMRRPEKRYDLAEAAVNRLREALPDVSLLVAEAGAAAVQPVRANVPRTSVTASGRAAITGRPAGVLVDQLARGDAQRQLDADLLVDVARDAVELRAVAFRRADRLEPVRASFDDMRHAA